MKNRIKKSIYTLFVALGMLPIMLTSCNYLEVDEYFNDLTPLDSIFARQAYLERYVWGTAGLMPNQGNLFANSYGPYMTAVDEVLMSWQKAEYAGTFLYADKVTQNSTYYNMWGQYYKGIRKCNTIFTRIDECKDLKGLDRREIMGLTHFMRASFYFYLLELYGPVVILPEVPLSVDADVDDLSFERNTYDECVEYICKDLEEAYELLDPTRPTTQFERPTKYAAAALMSRVRLYQASKWYNGNPFYTDWKTSDGRNMISQQYDPVKWAKSAAASKRIIDCGLYALHTVFSDENTQVCPQASQANFPDGVGGIDPFHSYADMFNGEALAVKNPELIYATGLARNVVQIAFPLKMGGWNGLGVTQKLVDAYYMNDGSDYVQQNDYYEQAGNVPTIATGYELRPTVAKMYLNREPRFYASIGFCECLWPGTSLTGNEVGNRTNLVAGYYVNGSFAKEAANPEDYNLTGYTLKKYIHPEDNCFNGTGSTVKAKMFPIFRYAETLLNYVEALNELKGEPEYTEEADSKTYSIIYNPEEIMYYFNMIRYRAGLPGITLAQAGDQATMRALIRRERMIEFACEGRRYHDLRRWGIAKEEENKPVQGMDVTKKDTERDQFYTVTNIMHKYALRNFEDRMYFYPIPRSVLDKNVKLKQNPGWDGWGEW